MTFDFGDGVGMETPHADVMIIMAVINDYRVKKVLIDDGSSVNLLPYHVLKRMRIRDSLLSLVSSYLRGISGVPVRVEGRIFLLITIGEESHRGMIEKGKIMIMEFIVEKC